jgi:REP element-mobilizing transposase RayT
LWPLIGRAFRDQLIKENFKVVSMSVGAVHSHCLSELPDDRKMIKAIVGRCKRAACEAIKNVQPGTIWAAGGELKPIADDEHFGNAYDYIFDQPRAWVWCERDGEAWNP